MAGKHMVPGLVLILALSAPLAAQEPSPAPLPDSVAVAEREPPGQRIIFPFIFYQPETKLGGGAAMIETFQVRGSTRTSTNNILLVATLRSQYSITASTERHSAGNRRRFAGEIGWSRFPDVFYGIGNDAQTTDDEKYTLENRRLAADLRRAVRRGLYVGVGATFQRTYMRKTEAGGLLAAGTITGSSGAMVATVGTTLMVDRRDYSFSPTRGPFAVLSLRTSAPFLGADQRYRKAELDLRDYHALGGGVLAWQALVTTIGGNPPFFEMTGIGGSNVVRGYFDGRFRDRARAVAQLEYRHALIGRLGLAAFTAAGQVANRPGDFSLDAMHPSTGIGLRFMLSPADRMNIRADYGFGRDSGGLYLAIGEAF